MTQLKYLILIFLLLLPIFYVSAAEICPADPNSNQLCNPLQNISGNSLPTFVERLIVVFSTFFGLTAIIMVVFSGFRMVISQGHAEDLTKARESLKWSILGFALSLLVFVLIAATANYIGVRREGPSATDNYGWGQFVWNPVRYNSFLDLLLGMLTGFLEVASLIAMGMIVFGGFKYVTARGDQEQATSAKETLQWAIVGLLVIALAFVLVRATATFVGQPK
ncbi:MAG: hypothetical protein HY336_01575 [Candidatus Doudnabacteria bacterium]|nr:hypothetical protein [Candidatus Doudnabacteria bacterium]